MSRFIAFFTCCLALLLPHRLRCWFAEGLGWLVQGAYFMYYGLLNRLLRELRDGGTGEKGRNGP